MTRRKPTATSNFGSGKRESHDASAFYGRFAAPIVSDDDTIDPFKAVDALVCGDSRYMNRLSDASVALVVTSPPYFAGKQYEEALGEGGIPANYLEYLQLLEAVFAECVRVLEPGGRIAVNVANLGRKPYRSLSADVITILQDRLGLLLRGEVIWRKAAGATGSCAWGSFQRPANPVLRDLTERVVIASKGRFDRPFPPALRKKMGLPYEATLTRDEFMEATTDVWDIPPESARRVGHPAPFPVELPERLIHLNTYVGDLVIDPFLGVGSTAVAAVRTGRHYAGYDLDPAYVAAAQQRVDATTRVERPAVAGVAASVAQAEGRSMGDFAAAVLADAGFRSVMKDRVVALRGADSKGRTWQFAVIGALTSIRPGLRRVDDVWRAIAEATVARAEDGLAPTPVVLLTTNVPTSGPGRDALRVALAPGGPLTDVIDVLVGEDRARLARWGRGDSDVELPAQLRMTARRGRARRS